MNEANFKENPKDFIVIDKRINFGRDMNIRYFKKFVEFLTTGQKLRLLKKYKEDLKALT